MLKPATVITLAVFAIALTGCKTAEERMQARLAADQAKCGTYGFHSGTESFANCMMRIDTAREEEAAAMRILEKQRNCMQATQAANNLAGGAWGGFAAGMNKSMACN